MDGLVLSQDEFLVLLDAVKSPDLVGINQAELIPQTQELHRESILRGIKSLQSRSLLRFEDEVAHLEPELLRLAQVVSRPLGVVVAIKDVPEVGSQKFVYYQHGPHVFEHTMPERQQYRFAAIPNLLALVQRINFLLGVDGPNDSSTDPFSLDQSEFFAIRELANNGNVAEVLYRLEKLCPDSQTASSLCDSMTSPAASSTVALLKIGDTPEVHDGLNVATLQGRVSAWLFTTDQSGKVPRIVVEQTSSSRFMSTLKTNMQNFFS